MKIHASGEDYLEAILMLQKKKGMVRSVDLARHMGFSKPSISHAVGILRKDEPTSGLDFDSMVQVAGLIRRLSQMGKVIFIVTHDFEFVCRTCSRVLHFDEGEMPDDVAVMMDFLPKLRELFSVSAKIP